MAAAALLKLEPAAATAGFVAAWLEVENLKRRFSDLTHHRIELSCIITVELDAAEDLGAFSSIEKVVLVVLCPNEAMDCGMVSKRSTDVIPLPTIEPLRWIWHE